MSQTGDTTSDPCSAKRAQILSGARKAFCELGYEGASVDLVAARAGVAKATVYKHFQDKKALFIECFAQQAAEFREHIRKYFDEPSGDVESSLQVAGEHLLQHILSPTITGLHRFTIAEASRFPEVGQAVFERGPEHTFAMIERYLLRWQERGALSLDDPRAAAVQFMMLCQADLALRKHLNVQPPPTEEEMRATVRRAVRTFLRAWGT